ncbi:uncharacterized protein A4U43_C05F32470 [Asparagus officinalis]|uniref:Cyclin-like domain-containing protein n=1 Tax=Asparagus officinalis TaxID=4686 RepID=A0A5P1EW99_ASPOF|nr:cyclin-D3-2-like [Asparagus officinalis]ONK70316.1 uncharacterized protein A4U43_C05F32470 [Asparagus officinalis]
MVALFDPLFCPEDPFLEEEVFEPNNGEKIHLFEPNSEFLASLISSEQRTHNFTLSDDPYLLSARGEAVQWIKTASARFGFNALTVILAVNYLDRCFLCSAGLRLQQDKPWMKQLSAVACLSLAAKVEETRVPFLLDLQIPPAEEVITGFVFESKTVRRMELLVLSTLGWRMNPVTALSFIQCMLPNLKKTCGYNAVGILRSCELVLLSVLSDWRWVQFPPSVWAAASMMQALGLHLDSVQHIMDLLQVSKERVEECHKLIVELVEVGKKRKSCYLDPPSPNEVIGSCFSYESSSSLDSWPISPEHKKPNCSII